MRQPRSGVEPVEVEEIAVVGVDALAPEPRGTGAAEEVREKRLALGPRGAPGRAEGLGRGEGHRHWQRAPG